MSIFCNAPRVLFLTAPYLLPRSAGPVDAALGDSGSVESSSGHDVSVDVISVPGRHSDLEEANAAGVHSSSAADIPSAPVLLQHRRRTSLDDVSAGRIGGPTLLLRRPLRGRHLERLYVHHLGNVLLRYTSQPGPSC